VAAAAGAATVVHQLGCSQVGDDAARTSAAFEGLATNPNVGAVLVISLGCETIQGRRLASRIEALGQRLEFVGIQDVGGSDHARALGIEAATRLIDELATLERVGGSAAQVSIGVVAPERSRHAERFAERALDAGIALLAADSTGAHFPKAATAPRYPAYERLMIEPGLTLVEHAGDAPQQHTALAAAGASVIVSFAGDDEAPSGIPCCPVVSVGSDSSLHRCLEGDFDALAGDGTDEVWTVVLQAQRGAPVKAEQWAPTTIALERLAMTL
jgi:altronate dehydratase large subunit